MNRTSKALRRWTSLLLVLVMTVCAILPAAAQSTAKSAGTVSVTIEYVDEDGQATYYLPPTQVELTDGMTALDALNAGYEGKGTVTYDSLWWSVTVAPNDGDPVEDSLLGDNAWWTFVNSTHRGIKKILQDGDVVRLIYNYNYGSNLKDYTDSSSSQETGTLSVDKNVLIQTLAAMSEEAIQENQELYDRALEIALTQGTSQRDVNSVAEELESVAFPEKSATDITVTPESVTLDVGESQQLTATLVPEDATDTVTWSSDDTSVVQVTPDGMLYAVGAGQATITAQANEQVQTSIPVTVNAVSAESITLDRTSAQLEEGEGLRLNATVSPAGSTDSITFSSSDPEVASVDAYGMVVAKSAGSAVITASVGALQASCTITVTPREEATSPRVIFRHDDGHITEADENNTITLSSLDVGSFELEGAQGISPYWSCNEKDQDGNSIIHISSGGIFYPHLGEREATVYSSNPLFGDAEEIATFTLKVVESGITDLKLYQDGREVSASSSVYLSGTETKTVTAMGKIPGSSQYVPIPVQALEVQADDGAYIWLDSSNNTIAFYAETTGQHTFTVSVGDAPDVTASFTATSQRIEVTGISVEYPETFSISSWNGLGDQYTGITSTGLTPDSRYTVTIEPSNATVKDVIWTSHDPEIAEYQETYGNGIVPKKSGTARFTVTSVDNPSVSQNLTITFQYQTPLEGVSLEQTSYTMKQYDSIDLDIVANPANATEQRFTWTYDKEGIVSVKDQVSNELSSSGGYVTKTTHTLSALQPGTVTVTGTPLDETNSLEPITFTVTVTESQETVELDFDRYVTQNIQHAQEYLEGTLEGNYIYGAEWSIFAILRSGGTLRQTDLNDYVSSVVEELKSGSRILPTDYFRIVTTLEVMGLDPTDLEGINIIERMYNYSNLDRLSSNMTAFTLLALDSKGYEIPDDALWNRETLIERLLTYQNPDNGGFGLSDSGTVSIDITAMTLQALAPYNNSQYPQVQAAVEKALTYLQDQMRNDCGYWAEGADNGCSAAQVLTALVSLGIDPLDPDSGFTRGSNNLVAKLDDFRLENGFTTFGGSNTPDGMATSQIAYALEAYRRFANGENGIYDLTDVGEKSQEEIDQAAAQEAMDLIDAIGTVTADSGEAIQSAREAYDSLTNAQKELVSNYDVLLAAEQAFALLGGNNGGNGDTPSSPDDTQPGENPQTGDSTAILPAALALTVSFALVAGRAGKRRKQHS